MRLHAGRVQGIGVTACRTQGTEMLIARYGVTWEHTSYASAV